MRLWSLFAFFLPLFPSSAALANVFFFFALFLSRFAFCLSSLRFASSSALSALRGPLPLAPPPAAAVLSLKRSSSPRCAFAISARASRSVEACSKGVRPEPPPRGKSICAESRTDVVAPEPASEGLAFFAEAALEEELSALPLPPPPPPPSLPIDFLLSPGIIFREWGFSSVGLIAMSLWWLVPS